MKRIKLMIFIMLLSISLYASATKPSSSLDLILNPETANQFDLFFTSDNQNKGTNPVVTDYNFRAARVSSSNSIIAENANSFSSLYAYWNVVSTNSFEVVLSIESPLTISGVADSKEIDVVISWKDKETGVTKEITSSDLNKEQTLVAYSAAGNEIIKKRDFQLLDINLEIPDGGFLGYTAGVYSTNLIVKVRSI